MNFAARYLARSFALALLLLHSIALAAPCTVRVYSGDGASPGAVQQTLAALETALGEDYAIAPCDASTLRHTDWEKDTALLVMPGGRDLPYVRDLGPDGAQRVRAFVERGGKYLGLCAGGYFAASSLSFYAGDPTLEIRAPRPLGFFPGTCSGPVYRDFEYNSERGAHAAPVQAASKVLARRTGETFAVYYNGGGAFLDADRYSNVEVLLRYNDIDRHDAAIVQCAVGDGSAILTGVHPEFDVADLTEAAGYQDGVLETLRENAVQRAILWRYLLHKLGL